MFQKYIQCFKGTTAIEYALIATGIALALTATIIIFGENLSALYDQLTAAVNSP